MAEETTPASGEDDKGKGSGEEESPKGGEETTPSSNGNGRSEFDEQAARDKIKKANAEAESLRKRLKEHEDANKSDTEKLSDRASNAEKSLAAAEKEVARLRVALKKGLTEHQAKRLVGETEEELEKDADELLKSFGNEGDEENEEDKGKEGKASSRERPKEKLKSGASPSSEPDEEDPVKLAESVPSMY